MAGQGSGHKVSELACCQQVVGCRPGEATALKPEEGGAELPCLHGSQCCFSCTAQKHVLTMTDKSLIMNCSVVVPWQLVSNSPYVLIFVLQVLAALEAAQKEPKAPLSDMFSDGNLQHRHIVL